jgi:hypothetical protein
MSNSKVKYLLVVLPLVFLLSIIGFQRFSHRLKAQETVNGSLETHGSQRILNMWGTNYEMGYAHGYLLSHDIMLMLEKYLFESEMGGSKSRWDQGIQAVNNNFIWGNYQTELDGMLAGMLAKRDENLDDPYYSLVFEGVGEGGGNREVLVSDLKVWNAFVDLGPFINCSSFAVWGETSASTESGTIHARNLDHARDLTNEYKVTLQTVMTYEPANGQKFFAISWPGFIGLFTGVNEQSVTITGNVSNGTSSSARNDYFPVALAGRQALEVADNQDSLPDVWTSWSGKERTKSYNIQVTEPYRVASNSGIVMESDSSGEEIREHETSYSHIITTNHYLQRTPANSPNSSSLTRYNTIHDLLINTYYSQGDHKVDAEEARSILEAVDQTNTIHSLVSELNAKRYYVYLASVVFNPTKVFTPAPETTPEVYLWSDLFPNHVVVPTDTPSPTVPQEPTVTPEPPTPTPDLPTPTPEPPTPTPTPTATPTPTPVQMIVDNRDAGFSVSGNWTTYVTDGGYGVDVRATKKSSFPLKTATWTTPITVSGNYKVYAMWAMTPYEEAPNAPYKIYHNGQIHTVYANQTANGDTWNLLGTYYFSSGRSDQKVTVSSNFSSGTKNAYVQADAVMLELVP